MCNFISWIEKDNHLYYLTDAKVFSKEGRRLQKQCQDNDILGHGAIRQYFADLDNKPMTGGRNCEVNDFWNLKKLPAELASKVADFDQHWGRMFSSGMFPNHMLASIIRTAPEEYADLAWKQLLKQKPSNYDLRCVIYNASEKYAAKAQKVLDRR